MSHEGNISTETGVADPKRQLPRQTMNTHSCDCRCVYCVADAERRHHERVDLKLLTPSARKAVERVTKP